MNSKQILFYVLLFGFLSIACWTKPKEINKEGHVCAYFRGFRMVSPFILCAYSYMMYDSIFLDCTSDLSGKVFFGAFLTLLFVAPLPYFVTRKITLIGEHLVSFSIFTGSKMLKLKDIESISQSYAWGGSVVKAGDQKIVLENMLSGKQELLKKISKGMVCL